MAKPPTITSPLSLRGRPAVPPPAHRHLRAAHSPPGRRHPVATCPLRRPRYAATSPPPLARHQYRARPPRACRHLPADDQSPTRNKFTAYPPLVYRPPSTCLEYHQPTANRPTAPHRATAFSSPSYPSHAVSELPPAHCLPTARPPLCTPPPSTSQPVAEPSLPTSAKKLTYDPECFCFHVLNASSFQRPRDVPHRLTSDLQ